MSLFDMKTESSGGVSITEWYRIGLLKAMVEKLSEDNMRQGKQ